MPNNTLFFLSFALFTIVNAQSQSTVTSSASYPSTSVPAPTDIPTVSGDSPLPLTQYHFSYPNVPYQINPFQVGRGPQFGYTLCNATTEGPNSNCQTAFLNDIDDFCLWGSPDPNETIGDVEAKVVAYCTKEGYGTRLIPPGALTAVQFMQTSAYIQVTGWINQTVLGLAADDAGGELDPHGADQLGNPLGGLVFSNNLPQTRQGDNFVQVVSWNNFIGTGQFCFKVCDPAVTSPNYCINIYDEIGCAYNAPAAYRQNEFASCEGDLQLPAGTYVSNGQTITWQQPSVLPATLPWQPSIPASSNCKTFSSEELYATAISASTSSATTAATGTGTASRSSGSGSPSATSSGQNSGTVASVESSMFISTGVALIVVLVVGWAVMA